MAVTVLVTDGEQRAALAAVRSLGRAGRRVIVAATRPRSLAGVSRYAARQAVAPDPLADPSGFADALSRIVREEQVDVLLPIAEPAILSVLDRRESFGACRIPFPTADVFRRVSDKAAVLALAPEVGIAVPEQRVLGSHAEAGAAAILGFPLVLKPWRSVADGAEGRRSLSVLHAANAVELEARIATLPAEGFPLLAQRRIAGPGVGIFLLIWDGEIRASFSHRRLREKPPAGGVSVYCESIAADAGLVSRSRGLLERLGWQGVAMVEFKIDRATGTPYLMEINGRLWGSLQLAIDAGVDFPALLVSWVLGEQPAAVTSWRAGARLRWEWGNLDYLLSRLRHTNAELSLLPDAPGRWGSLRESGGVWRRGDRLEVLRARDPAPFLLETWRWLTSAASRGRNPVPASDS
jgi:predicted ATP-grasp superfamily ATP-dependent carboligase